jgi:hypothetical protein
VGPAFAYGLPDTARQVIDTHFEQTSFEFIRGIDDNANIICSILAYAWQVIDTCFAPPFLELRHPMTWQAICPWPYPRGRRRGGCTSRTAPPSPPRSGAAGPAWWGRRSRSKLGRRAMVAAVAVAASSEVSEPSPEVTVRR